MPPFADLLDDDVNYEIPGLPAVNLGIDAISGDGTGADVVDTVTDVTEPVTDTVTDIVSSDESGGSGSGSGSGGSDVDVPMISDDFRFRGFDVGSDTLSETRDFLNREVGPASDLRGFLFNSNIDEIIERRVADGTISDDRFRRIDPDGIKITRTLRNIIASGGNKGVGRVLGDLKRGIPDLNISTIIDAAENDRGLIIGEDRGLDETIDSVGSDTTSTLSLTTVAVVLAAIAAVVVGVSR